MPREQLLSAILEFLAEEDLLTRSEIRTALEREIDSADAGALAALEERIRTDIGWGYYPPDPLARRIHHVLAGRFLQPESTIEGAEYLSNPDSTPVVICANHLSYADANVIEVLLHRSAAADLASRLTAIAGPKVFSSRQRRFSSLCFGTIKVSQSADVSTGEARLSAREVARAARLAIDAARERLAAGDALLLFGEGTRSRTGAMQPMLPGVARYLDVLPGLRVVPVGLVGSEKLFPIDGATVQPAQVVMKVGEPISADALLARADGGRRVVVDAIGSAIADLLPPQYRGVYEQRSSQRFSPADPFA